MARYGFVVDLRTCIGCGACVAACTEENTPVLRRLTGNPRAVVPLGSRRDVIVVEEGVYPAVRRVHHHRVCAHCDNPPCVGVCPTGATYKTPEGAVVVDYDKCIGCRYCVVACPYGARYVNEDVGGPDKCTMCIHRVREGLAPACAESCPTRSIVFGDLDDPESPAARAAARAVPVGAGYGTRPRLYVIPP